MNRPEGEFLKSSIGKVVRLIDLHYKIKYAGEQKERVNEVTSMRDIEGFV
jgi:hypothetical protein